MAAVRSPDVAFVVMIGGPGVNGERIILEQQYLISRAMGVSEDDATKERAQSEGLFRS